MLPGIASYSTLAQTHHSSSVAPAVWMDVMRTVNPPLDDGQVINGELHYQPSGPVQVPDHSAKLSPVILIGCFTLVVRNATAVWISLRARALRNNNCATVWWNCTACSLGSTFLSISSRTLEQMTRCWSLVGLHPDFFRDVFMTSLT